MDTSTAAGKCFLDMLGVLKMRKEWSSGDSESGKQEWAMFPSVRQFVADESGATAIEYSLIAAGISNKAIIAGESATRRSGTSSLLQVSAPGIRSTKFLLGMAPRWAGECRCMQLYLNNRQREPTRGRSKAEDVVVEKLESYRPLYPAIPDKNKDGIAQGQRSKTCQFPC